MYYSQQQVATLEGQNWAFVKTSLHGHVFTVTLDRPEKKNALHPTTLCELAFALAHARYNPAVRVIVLAATGSVWCAGADLKAFGGGEQPQSTVPEPTEPILLGELLPATCKPVIAKVHAPVMAGGILLLCGCNYVVSSVTARFGLPETRRGLFPFQVMAALIERMPAQAALDWCLRALELSAAEAHAHGLVTEVCSEETLEARVSELCETLCAQSPQAIQLGLEAYAHLRAQKGSPAQQAYLQEMFFRCVQTEDAQEGTRAFLEKRPPVWR